MCLNAWCSSHFQFPKEAEIENLQLLIQLHSNNAVFTINTEQDSCGLPVLSQNYLHLRSTHTFIHVGERFSKCVVTTQITHNNRVLKLDLGRLIQWEESRAYIEVIFCLCLYTYIYIYKMEKIRLILITSVSAAWSWFKSEFRQVYASLVLVFHDCCLDVL